MAKITISIELADESLLSLLQMEEDGLRGFVIRIISPKTTKPSFAIGMVPNPAEELAIVRTICGKGAMCQMMYDNLESSLIEGIMFRFKHRYNEDTAFYELNEQEEQDLLTILAND